ncbi:MAG TPA: hypothetical protein VIG99_13505 [Myxococcaceae bacterium]
MKLRHLIGTLALAAGAAGAQPHPAPDPFAPKEPVERPAPTFDLVRRLPRITAELLLGGGSALGMAYGGYQLGCSLSSDPVTTACGQYGAYGAVSGFALGIPIGVMLGGALADGDGWLLSTVFGTGLGMATALGVSYLLRETPGLNPLPLLLLPLTFAVAGYELTSHDSRAAAQAEARGRRLALRVLPMAAVTPGGAALGLTVLLP